MPTQTGLSMTQQQPGGERPGLISWPERPTYEEPESAIDWKKVIGHCVQARLPMKEFSFVLNTMGRIDDATKTKAAKVYTLKLAEYEDDLMRMKTQRGVDAKSVEQGAKSLENQRRYDLDLAKTAMAAGESERDFGLKAKKEQRETLEGKQDFGLGLIKEKRLQKEETAKPADQLSWTEKELFKSVNRELGEVRKSLADPLAGDRQGLQTRATDLMKAMKDLRDREAGAGSGRGAAGGTDPRQTALRRIATELKTKFPGASGKQLKELLKLKSGVYGEGEEAAKMWEQIMMELSSSGAQETGLQPKPAIGGGGEQHTADYLDRYQRPQRPRWGSPGYER